MKPASQILFFKPKEPAWVVSTATIRSRHITALLKDKRKNSRPYFEALQQEIAVLSQKLLSADSMDFTEITTLVDKALLLMELDVYLPSAVPTEKDRLLKKIPEIILHFFEKNRDNANVIVQLLDILSRNNFEAKYDYGWLYGEKIMLFQSIVQTLAEQFFELLKNDTPADKKISMSMVVLVISALPSWMWVREWVRYPPSELIHALEIRFQPGTLCSHLNYPFAV